MTTIKLYRELHVKLKVHWHITAFGGCSFGPNLCKSAPKRNLALWVLAPSVSTGNLSVELHYLTKPLSGPLTREQGLKHAVGRYSEKQQSCSEDPGSTTLSHGICEKACCWHTSPKALCESPVLRQPSTTESYKYDLYSGHLQI